MRMAFVVTSMERAGAQGMLLKLLPGLIRRGLSPRVISLTSSGPLSADFSKLDIPVHHLEARPGRVSIAALRRLIHILKQGSPQLVQGWMYHGNLAAQVAAWFLPQRPPVAWGIRGTHTELNKEKGLTAVTIWLGAKLSHYPDAIIYNSKVSAVEHWRKLKYHREHEVVIPNGFDVAVFKPAPDARRYLRDELHVPEETVLIGLVARFHPVKDHATFIQAIARVCAKHRSVNGVLIGEGAHKNNQELLALLSQAGMEKFIHCLGERRDIAVLTAGLDVGCNSSISEGFPNAIGECMACGVPCVVTDVGDNAWIVGETGRVVPASDPEQFASALHELIDVGPERRRALGARARQRIMQEFSLDAAVKRHAELYQMLVDRVH